MGHESSGPFVWKSGLRSSRGPSGLVKGYLHRIIEMDLESTQRAELTPAVPENNSPTYNHSSQNNSMSHDVDEVSFTTSNHSLPHCQLQNANPLSEPAKKITPAVMAKLLKGKDKEWAAVVDKKGSLQLLDLPVDVLKEIIKEVRYVRLIA